MFQLPSDIRARIWKTARFQFACDKIASFLKHKAIVIKLDDAPSHHETLTVYGCELFASLRVGLDKEVIVALHIIHFGETKYYESRVDVLIRNQRVVISLHCMTNSPPDVRLSYSTTQCYRHLKHGDSQYITCKPFWTCWG
jgi:hypothetical protein